MKSLTISAILDTIFCLFCSFAVAFVVIRYFLPLTPTYILSILLSITVSVVTFCTLKNKTTKTALNKKENSHRIKIIGQLCFLTKQQQSEEFYKALLISGKKINKIPLGLVIDDEYSLYPAFTFNNLSPQDLADIKRIDKSNLPITVYAIEFDEKTTDFAKKLDITLKNSVDAYSLFKSANYYPELKVEFAETKKSVRNILQTFLTKKHAKSFALSGLSLLFLSFLTPFKIYYIIFGCILMIFAILSKFYGKKNTQNNDF